nr:helix-turn-helix transcriptional regulator [Actinomadura sp. RB99]
MLGAQLRRLREAKGVTRQDAGYAIRASESKISLLELGRVSFKERDVSDLLTLYGVTDEAERESLLRLARNANTSDWWHRYNDVLPGWFQTYVGLEEQAALVRIYESRFVPELLQTEQYARATFPQCHSQAVEREIDLRVELRMQRQQRLTTPDAPKLWVVLDEAALNRFPGGPEVMRGQFEHLIEMSRLPNVAIQIMPFWFGRHVPVNGTFTMLRFPEQDVPEMVYIETLAGAMYLDKRDEVNAYQMAMERLCTESEPQDRTIEILYDLVRRSA